MLTQKPHKLLNSLVNFSRLSPFSLTSGNFSARLDHQGRVILAEDACMFDVLDLPEDSLKQILPKLSSRSLVRLLTAYPRTLSNTFMTLLYQSMSPCTMEFLREEMVRSQLPSFQQIREAESELISVIQ